MTLSTALTALRHTMRVPTTAAGCEMAIFAVWFGGRALNMLQVAIAASWGLAVSPRPWLAAACMLTFCTTTAVILTKTARRGGHQSSKFAAVDMACICAILLLQIWFTHPGDRINSWAGWAYPTAIAVTTAAGTAFRRRREVLVAVISVVTCYLVSTFPAAADETDRLTVLVNSLVFGAFAVLAFTVSGFLRRLAADADAARAAAAEAGRHAELDRNRLLLHDQETILRLLSEPELDPALVGLLQQQAAAGASRIRSFLSDDSAPDPGSDALPAIARRVSAGFTDLPMTVSTDLAADVCLEPPAAAAVTAAMTTLLHNVRVHAGATEVVVHAAADGPTGWEVSVHDNGCGFDPQATPFGFGLDRQVVGALAAHGIAADIDSAPGEGTIVVLRRPCASVS